MFRVVQRLALGMVALLLVAAPLAAQVNRNVRFGEPKPQPALFADPKVEDVIIPREQYVLSFNGKTNTPNWVSWHLMKSDIGTEPRAIAFEPDDALPKGFAKVTSSIYNRTGFDRGHMCPSKDRSDTQANNEMTFLLTNVVPQSPNNNRVTWEHLEAYSRTLAEQGNSLYIVAGPHGMRGEGKNGFANSITKGPVSVVVPTFTWKVIMVLPEGQMQPDKQTRMIAVIVPNTQSVDPDWTKYRHSVEEVEELTKLTFFPNIKDRRLATILKEHVDNTVVDNAVTNGKNKKAAE